MSLLRQAAAQFRRQASGAQQQQQRLVGNMPVKPNKYIEEWGTRREHLETEYKWDNKTLITLAIWIGAVPYLIYEVTVGEFNRTDAVAQRPARAMLGSES